MSTTHLLYDSGTVMVPPGPLTQIGPTLDVRKCAKIRVVAHEVAPGPPGPILIDLYVKEGAVALPFAAGIVFPLPPDVPESAVFDVPGRELEIFVRELGAPKKLRLLVFGLEL